MRSLVHPLDFGRRSKPAPDCASAAATAGDDLRLFAVTFAAGFVFLSVFLA